MKIVAVDGLEPATSPKMGRFANLASRQYKSPHDESRGHVIYLLLIKFT